MGMFQFAPNENKETVIEMKVATSLLSPEEQAQHALLMEIAGDEGFDKVQAKALKISNDTLREALKLRVVATTKESPSIRISTGHLSIPQAWLRIQAPILRSRIGGVIPPTLEKW